MAQASTRWGTIVETLAPVVTTGVRDLAILTPFIIHGIQIAEAAGVEGDQKLGIAIDEVQNGIAALNAVRPGTVDPELATSALTSVISAIVDMANLIASLGH